MSHPLTRTARGSFPKDWLEGQLSAALTAAKVRLRRPGCSLAR